MVAPESNLQGESASESIRENKLVSERSGRPEDSVVVSSISFDQHEILRNIIRLYSPGGYDLDVCFGLGGFYKKGVPLPNVAYDICPRVPGVVAADCRAMPNKDSSLKSIVFDPPFLPGSRDGVMKLRFGALKTLTDIEDMYSLAFREFKRVLRPGGIVVVKCQDITNGKQQHIIHNKVINMAEALNFEVLDLFVLLSRSRIRDKSKSIVHSRKYHCYFIVFKKRYRRKRRPNGFRAKLAAVRLVDAGRIADETGLFSGPEGSPVRGITAYPPSTEDNLDIEDRVSVNGGVL